MVRAGMAGNALPLRHRASHAKAEFRETKLRPVGMSRTTRKTLLLCPNNRMRKPIFAFSLLLTGLLVVSAPAGPTDWPNWRGPNGNGAAAPGEYPLQCNAESILWKAPLPGKGCSTPVVWEQRVYLTAAADGEDAVLAFDWSGKQLWLTKLGVEKKGKHRNGSGSNPSPITDGESIFVNFKSGNLAALDLDGKVRWATNLVTAFGPESLFWDHGTSPVLAAGNVIMARMHGGDSWLAAFDKKTGQLRWKTARNYDTPNEVDNGYTTPLILKRDGRELVLTWGAEHLTAHDAADGKLIWSVGGFNPDRKGFWPAVATPVVVDDVAVVPFGRSDRGQPLLYGVKLQAGDAAAKEIWKRNDTGTFVPSPAEYKGLVYLLRDRGEVECVDPKTGQTVWKDAFPRASSSYYSSPAIANGRLYAVREDGSVFVAGIEGKFELLAEGKIDDRFIATPVLLDNRLFLRGEKELVCVGNRL